MIHLLTVVAAVAAVDAPATNGASLPGADRVILAEPRPAGDVVGSVGFSYFQSRGLLQTDAYHERQVYRAVLAWSPWSELTLGLSEELAANYDAGFRPASLDSLGNPHLLALGTYRLGDAWSAALLVDVWLPTAGTSGLHLAAVTPTALAAITGRFGDVRLGANLGYRLDRSDEIFPQRRDPAQEFANNVSYVDGALVGLAADWSWAALASLELAPFAELYLDWGPQVALAKGNLSADAGVKLVFVEVPLQLQLGGRARIMGEPRKSERTTGLPPYEVVVGVSYRFGAEARPARSCQATSECDAGLTCVDGRCTRIVEQIVEKTVEKIVERAVTTAVVPKTFVIIGTVLDTDGQKPVADARISLGTPNSPRFVSGDDGTFQTCPVAVQSGGIVPIKVDAVGFQPFESAVPTGEAGETIQATFELVPSGLQTATIRGLAMNLDGTPVKGCVVRVPAFKIRSLTDAKGAFELTVPAKELKIEIRCKGYVPQATRVKFDHPGETVVFNFDLERPGR